jgi:AcrR family transcriptional regulator
MTTRNATDAWIVDAARRLLEIRGSEGLPMDDVAHVVVVRAPSLFGHFADRASLIDAVERSLWQDLGRTLRRAATDRGSSPMSTVQARGPARCSARERSGG